MKLRGWTAVPVAAALVAFAAACESVDSNQGRGEKERDTIDAAFARAEGPDQALKIIAENTQKVGSAKFSSASKAPGGGVVEMAGSYDWNKGTAEAKRSGSGASQLRGKGAIRFTGSHVYYNAEGGDNKWLSAKKNALGAGGYLSSSLTQINPLRAISMAQGAKAVEQKEEKHKDQKLIHYSFVSHVKELVKRGASPGIPQTEVVKMRTLLKLGGAEKIHVDIWVGQEGVPMKIRIVTPGSVAPSDVTATFEEFGNNVSVEAPEASLIKSSK
jgi:hypothetical protein